MSEFTTMLDAMKAHVTANKTVKTFTKKKDDARDAIIGFAKGMFNITDDTENTAFSEKYEESGYSANIVHVHTEGIDPDLLREKFPEIHKECLEVTVSLPPGDIPPELMKYINSGVATIERTFNEKLLDNKIKIGEVNEDDLADCKMVKKNHYQITVKNGG